MVNTNHGDLHPADRHNRLALRDHLRQTVAARGMSNRELSRSVGFGDHWAAGIFAQETWRASTIQQLCRVLGLELMFDVRLPLVALEPRSVEIENLCRVGDELREGIPLWRDELKRILLADLGARIRVARQVSIHDQARVLTSTPAKVRDWEEGKKPDYLLVTAQRYFRALGHPLGFSLRPMDGDGCYQVPGLRALEPGAEERVHIEQRANHTYVWNSLEPGNVITFSAAAWQRWLREAE